MIHKHHALPAFFWLSLLFACGNQPARTEPESGRDTGQNDPKLSLEEQIAAHIEKELETEVGNDTIVLNHIFGMSKRDVMRHKNRLKKKKKLYRVRKSKNVWEYVYDIRLQKTGKLRTYFEGFFYDNPLTDKEELYKMECLPTIDKGKVRAIEVVKEIRPIYENEYGPYDFVIPNKDDTDCKTYLWVNGNLKIELGCEEERVFIYYTDIPRARLAAKDSDL